MWAHGQAERMARSTAPRFITGSVPGSARSTAQACVLGSAPKAVAARLKILLCVDSWAWVLEADDDFVAWTSGGRGLAIRCRFGNAPASGGGQVEVGGLLKLVRGIQGRAFLEVIADELQAHRHAASPKPAGTLMPGRPASGRAG